MRRCLAARFKRTRIYFLIVQTLNQHPERQIPTVDLSYCHAIEALNIPPAIAE